jgi:hypothetical protein
LSVLWLATVVPEDTTNPTTHGDWRLYVQN